MSRGIKEGVLSPRAEYYIKIGSEWWDNASEAERWEYDVDMQLGAAGMAAIELLEACHEGDRADFGKCLAMLLKEAETLNELWCGERAQKLGQA